MAAFFVAAMFFSVFRSYAFLPSITPIVVAPLDVVIPECSGLEYAGAGWFWAQNDGRHDNRIYRFDSSGVVASILTISNAINEDWEDLTHDNGKNFLYIGDFGNNLCDRQNLRIYRIPYPSAGPSTQATADSIRFSYPDQTVFPSPWLNFDAEAFIHYGNNLYVFTKSDGAATGYTKLYRLPDQPGTYVATFIDSFYTNDRITSADINDDSSAMVLLSNDRIHLFTGWIGDDFFTGTHVKLTFSTTNTHKEGIAFTSRSEVWMSDENTGNGNNLYRFDMVNYFPIQTGIGAVADEHMVIFPNPADERVTFNSERIKGSGRLEILDVAGIPVAAAAYSGIGSVSVNTGNLPAGLYELYICSDDGKVAFRRFAVAH